MIIKKEIRLKITISHWLWSGVTAVGSKWCIMFAGINQIESSNRNISQGVQFLKVRLIGTAGFVCGASLTNCTIRCNLFIASIFAKFVAGSGNTLIVDVVMLVILR